MTAHRNQTALSAAQRDLHGSWHVLGWIGAFVFAWGGATGISLFQNFFDWEPELQMGSVVCGVVYLLALIAVVALSWPTWQGGGTILPLVLCALLALTGLAAVDAEQIDPGSFMGRKMVSPLWFRVLLLGLYLLPGLIFAVGRFVRLRRDWLVRRDRQQEGRESS